MQEPAASEKLQKVLAERGLGSRREMERWIEQGRVEVSGERAHLGQRVAEHDRIQVDGRLLRRYKRSQGKVLIFNKPIGLVCTRHDPEGRPTVFDKLPGLKHARWISIGRLDIATSGLLLLTDDGDLANRMMHPSTGLDREYAVRINGQLSDEQMQQLKDGILDQGDRLAFSDIQYFNGTGSNHWYHVVLLEGKNREIRRLFEYLGFSVSRLKRVRFGPVLLPSRLARGRSEVMSDQDVAALFKLLGLPYVQDQPTRGKSPRTRAKDSVLIEYPELALKD